MDAFIKSFLFWAGVAFGLVALLLVAIYYECGPIAIICDLICLVVSVAFIADIFQDSLMFND